MNSAAVLMEQIYADVSVQKDQAIEGALYSILGITNLPAAPASGPVTFSVPSAASSSITIPSGTVVGLQGLTVTYATTQDATIPSGSTSVTVPVVCTQAGSVGNVPAGSITAIVSPSSLLQQGVSVTNPYPLLNGRDAETDEQKAARAQQVLARLHRGDKEAVEFGALQAKVLDANGNVIEQAVKAQAVAGSTPGTCVVYVYNGTPYGSSTGAASSALLQAVQNELNGYQDSQGNIHYGYLVAGQQATVQAATESQVNVTVTPVLQPGYTLSQVTSTIQANIQDYFNNLDIGDGVSLSAIAQACLQVPGVIDVTVNAPTTAPAATAGTLYMLGTVTVQ